MPDETLTVRLGAEEVVFLLRALGLKSLPGLGDDATQGLSDDQVERALAAGANSLRARGWVHAPADSQPWQVETLLAAMFITCATAPRVLVVTRQPADRAPEAMYVHLGDDMTVAHRLPEAGVHEFTAAVDRRASLAEVARLLNLADQPRPAGEAMRLPGATLDELTTLVQAGEGAKAEALLRANDAPGPAAESFVRALTDIRSNALVMLMNLHPAEPAAAPTSQGFTLIEGAEGFWFLKSHGENGREVLGVEPATADENRARLAALLN